MQLKKIIAVVMAAMMSAVILPATAAASKWTKTDKGYTYTYNDGTTAKPGWLKVGKSKYYITKNGTRKTGWMSTKTDKYYFDSTGKMVTGVYTIDKSDYKFADDGKLLGDNIHFVLNKDTKCLHLSDKCNAAKKIDKANYGTLDAAECEFDALSEEGYWACGSCAQKYKKLLPKPKK